jgi:hypothetical protein
MQNEIQWWARGDTGETVLSNVEYFLLNRQDIEGFIHWAKAFGLGYRDIITIIKEEAETYD